MSAVRRNRHTSDAHNWQDEPSTPTRHHPDPPPRPLPTLTVDMPPKGAPVQTVVDKTDPVLLAMSDEEFKQAMDAEAGIGRPTLQEVKAMEEVLLPKPKTKEDEQALFARVMQSLRERVIALEKEDDPDFDPDCIPNEDREGYADDPLLRLTSGIGGRPAQPDSTLQLPRKL